MLRWKRPHDGRRLFAQDAGNGGVSENQAVFANGDLIVVLEYRRRYHALAVHEGSVPASQIQKIQFAGFRPLDDRVAARRSVVFNHDGIAFAAAQLFQVDASSR